MTSGERVIYPKSEIKQHAKTQFYYRNISCATHGLRRTRGIVGGGALFCFPAASDLSEDPVDVSECSNVPLCSLPLVGYVRLRNVSGSNFLQMFYNHKRILN